MTRLIAHKMALDAIPVGGCTVDGIKFLTNRVMMTDSLHRSTKWVKNAILAIRNAAEPNQYKNATDEEIAGEILRRIEEKRGKCRT